MSENTHLEITSAEAERPPEPPKEKTPDLDALSSAAADLGRRLVWLPGPHSPRFFSERFRALCRALKPVLAVFQGPSQKRPVGDDYRWLSDNLRLVHSDLRGTKEGFKLVRKLPHVRNPDGTLAPRVVAVAAGFLAAAGYEFNESSFSSYVQAFQRGTALKMVELWALVPALKLVLLEEIAARGSKIEADPEGSYGVGVCVRSLRDIGQTSWKNVIEPLILFDRVLRDDPAGAYPKMDFESRDLYRTELAKVAEYSDLTETEVAAKAVALAKAAQKEKHDSARLKERRGHVGYYLLAEGAPALYATVGYEPPLGRRIASFLRRHPDEYYLPATEVLTLAIMSAIVLLLTNTYTSPMLILFSMLVLLLAQFPECGPGDELPDYSAAGAAAFFPSSISPKGFPTTASRWSPFRRLLLNEKQVRRLVDDLEVRYLGNHDPNIHFALLTDLPDSREPARGR